MLGFEHWDALDAVKYQDEQQAIERLLAQPIGNAAQRASIDAAATALVEAARRYGERAGVVQNFLQEFPLSSEEGLVLMCLAEALLRTPDAATQDRLIAEQIASADWAGHLGRSDSLFVNASTWALMLTGKLIEPDPEARADLAGFVRRLAARAGEPVLRGAIAALLGIMSKQFVLGRTVGAALARARSDGLVCSFDMLGEGARTQTDAARYHQRYADAIEAVGVSSKGLGPEAGHGVSVKLSALSPRYEAAQEARVGSELYPRLLHLAAATARHDINLTIDAEEADRLVLSLKLLERLCSESSLAGWRGLGIAVQAYQPRSLSVIDQLADLARRTGRRLMVRLVKGAYWDSEIKRAQVAGMPGYPVFTTKQATDVCFLNCARRLIAAAPDLYAQFATHNAHTLAAVRHLATEAGITPEFQRLHGMGETLYDAAWEQGDLRLRIYAPVGGHEELLPYLVRRLLENGTNSSFVHRLLDKGVPAREVARDPYDLLAEEPRPNPRIRRPRQLYGDTRVNSLGRDISIAAIRDAARSQTRLLQGTVVRAGPMIGGEILDGPERPVRSPSDPGRIVGTVVEADMASLELAAERARAAAPRWNALGGPGRAVVLRKAGDAIEACMDPLVALLAAEGGKTFDDAVSEVREAADFCRYYALLAERQFAGPATLEGPAGELNMLELYGRGVAACISPWNFPLAIFIGQVAAALAAGNAVIAKPAEQTPLIACEAARLFRAAGLDADLLAVLPGSGEAIGAALVSHPGIDCLAFTGGTDTAWAINRALAARPGPIIPFVAETGGLNAMFVDTTALREQVIDDALRSGFGSAGQRCSALRMLFLPRETAGDVIEGLVGAMDALAIGDPADPATDMGPVIDAEAKTALHAHLLTLERGGRIIARHPGTALPGHFFAPVIAEVDAPDFLEREVFGPILHICRYSPEELEPFARRLAARGYGLTLGVHSRLDSFERRIRELVPAGNIYVNRPMTGAVVGVQPFGGLGLSGTGPKAGGPHALLPFAQERSLSTNLMARGGDPSLLGSD